MKLYFKAKQRVKSGVISHFGQHPLECPLLLACWLAPWEMAGCTQCHISFLCSLCFPKKVAAAAS